MAVASRVGLIPQDSSDGDLVASVRRGSDAAFEELYARYSRRISAYVYGMVGDHGRAEDITQETFISALRRMRETDRAIAFKPWIHEIAKNACIDSFRRARRAQEVSLDADDGLSSADRGRLTAVSAPDAALDSKQALQDLRGAFGGLSDNHHEILVLREFEGRSYRDIGERLGMSRHMVESTLFRARRRLAEEYDELSSGRRCEFVRKMVDSGPQYSLGIRDRRRIAGHLAHCQSCRAHARSAGFDESILNMPSVAAKLAAVLPIPVLPMRWAIMERFGSARPRPSLLALRSVHALARSSDQIVGAGPGAGRSAATAAALVLAGVGGGIVTANYSSGDNPLHGGTQYAAVHPAHAAATPGRTEATPRTSAASWASTRAGKKKSLHADSGAGARIAISQVRTDASRPGRQGAAKAGADPTASPSVAGTEAPTDTGAPNVPATVSTGGPAGSPASATTGSGDATTGAAPVQTGTPSDPASPVVASPVSAAPVSVPPVSAGTLSSGLGTITAALPQVPPDGGLPTKPTGTDPVTGTVGTVVSGAAQVAGSF